MKLLPTLPTLAAILAKYFILKLFFKYFKLFLKVSKLKPEQSLGKVRVQYFFCVSRHSLFTVATV